MRPFIFLAAFAACGHGSCADVLGTVCFGKTTRAMLTVGYVGLAQNREVLRSSCGMTVGAGFPAGEVKSTTFDPRNSELSFRNGVYLFKHTALPSGTYYVYAKLGDALVAGQTVSIGKSNGTKRLAIDLRPLKTGGLTILVGSKGAWMVRLAPATRDGKPMVSGLDLGQELQIEAKAADGRISFPRLAAGRYILSLLKVTKSGGDAESHWEAYETAGTFAAQVDAGKILEYRLN